MTWRGYDPWYVYELVDPRGEVVFYIGKTATPDARFSQHRSSKASAAYYRLQVIAEAGFQAKMNVIGEFKTESEALDYEGYLISRTPGLVNRTGPYATGNPPTKPLVRPVVGGNGDDQNYEPDVELPPKDQMDRRLFEVLGGDVPEDHISRILEAMDLLAHEDAEYVYATDE